MLAPVTFCILQVLCRIAVQRNGEDNIRTQHPTGQTVRRVPGHVQYQENVAEINSIILLRKWKSTLNK